MPISLDGTTGISASGNITGAFFIGNGSAITGFAPAKIANGTSEINLGASGGNANISIGGTSNIAVFSSTGLAISGDLSVTGNATLSGNILGDRIQNGTTQIDIQTQNGNANITVGGVSNVAVFSSTGLFVEGVNSVTGNVTGANLLTSGLISATGNITGGNINGGANVNATTHTGTTVSVTGNIDSGNLRTVGLISATGTLTGSSLGVATGNITGGNLILSGAIEDSAQLDIRTTATNSNIALAPNGTGQVTVSSALSVVGNITGGNVLGGANVNATTLTGTTVSVSGNIDAGNLRTGGLISATGAITGAGITGTSLTVSTGNVTLGNLVNAGANGVGNLGSATGYFNTVFAKATSAQYADLAERYRSDADYQVGTVLCFGGPEEVTISRISHSTNIAGTVSHNPSYIMNAGLESTNPVTVALLGRVPCRVIGRIQKGDLLVSSSVPGVATKIDQSHYQPGCVVGKSLENYDNDEEGLIEIVVGRL